MHPVPTAETVKVKLLQHCRQRMAGDVIELPRAEAAEAVRWGEATYFSPRRSVEESKSC